MTRIKNFITHTGVVFYITVIKGRTVAFEMPESPPKLVIHNYNG